MEKPSMKKRVITNLAAMLTHKEPRGNKLTLLTAAGAITGTPILQHDIFAEESNEKDVIVLSAQQSAAEYRKEFEFEQALPGNDGFVILQNAVLKNDRLSMDSPYLIVFFDEIIAVTADRLG